MHRLLTKRRRVERTEIISQSDFSSGNEDQSTSRGSRNRGVVFHPPPADRWAVVCRRHAGKEPQILRSAQQLQHLGFIGIPPGFAGHISLDSVLDSYSFTSGALSLRTRLQQQKVVSPCGTSVLRTVCLQYPHPPRASSLRDLICALSSFHMFAK